MIGGGPAGCAAAYRLRRQGHEPVLVESAPQLGGRSWTLREDGFTIDTGAFYVCSFYRRTLDVLEELGMRSSLVPMPDDTGLLDEGERRRWVVGSTGSVWGHPKLTLGDKLRLTVAGIRESIGRPDPLSTEALAGADDGRTVAESAREAVGEHA